MKILTKTALAVTMAALFASAQAAEVELVFDPIEGVPQESVEYSFDGLNIDQNGKIKITGAAYLRGFLPGSDGSLSCGDNTTQIGNECVGTGGGPGSSSSSSSKSSSSSSSSSSSVNVGDCEVAADTTLISPIYSWQQYTGSLQIPLPANGTTLSFPVTTGNRNGATGGMSGGELSWTAGVVRKMWISSCPGGTPVSALCSRESTAALGINWVQGTGRGMCELQRNTTYYVNMKNVFDPINTGSNCYIGKGIPNCYGFIQHKPSGSID